MLPNRYEDSLGVDCLATFLDGNIMLSGSHEDSILGCLLYVSINFVIAGLDGLDSVSIIIDSHLHIRFCTGDERYGGFVRPSGSDGI